MLRPSLFVLLILLNVFCSAWAFASPSNFHTWSVLRYSHDSGDYEFGGQLQHRYRFDTDKLFEEQLNLFVDRHLGEYELTFIFTLGSQNGYDRLREVRYALEVERDFQELRAWVYNLRLRHETRDFKSNPDLAHRFRVRNEFRYEIESSSIDGIFVNGELNIYLNNYQPEAAGFSSFRTIIGVSGSCDSYQWGLAYLNDHRQSPIQIENRHVLQMSLEFQSSN